MLVPHRCSERAKAARRTTSRRVVGAPDRAGASMSHGSTRRLLVEDLTVSRGGRLVFRGLSFRLDQGQVAEVTGSNGIGKSTLLRAIAGFLPATSGHASWIEPGSEERVPVAERLHYVGHLDGLKLALTAHENLKGGVALEGQHRMTPRAALQRLELAHVLDLPVGYLSAGQRRRVALARLLVTDRPLWLLDEPSTALDRRSREILEGVVTDHLREGGLTLAATHETLGLPGSLELRLARP